MVVKILVLDVIIPVYVFDEQALNCLKEMQVRNVIEGLPPNEVEVNVTW